MSKKNNKGQKLSEIGLTIKAGNQKEIEQLEEDLRMALPDAGNEPLSEEEEEANLLAMSVLFDMEDETQSIAQDVYARHERKQAIIATLKSPYLVAASVMLLLGTIWAWNFIGNQAGQSGQTPIAVVTTPPQKKAINGSEKIVVNKPIKKRKSPVTKSTGAWAVKTKPSPKQRQKKLVNPDGSGQLLPQRKAVAIAKKTQVEIKTTAQVLAGKSFKSNELFGELLAAKGSENKEMDSVITFPKSGSKIKANRSFKVKINFAQLAEKGFDAKLPVVLNIYSNEGVKKYSQAIAPPENGSITYRKLILKEVDKNGKRVHLRTGLYYYEFLQEDSEGGQRNLQVGHFYRMPMMWLRGK